MCVIVSVEHEDLRPSEAMIRKMWDRNPDGGGLAWREERAEGGSEIVEVVWQKGLGLGEMLEIMPTLPLPYIAHFRIATSGEKIKEHTHPFPVDARSTLALEGRTRGRVFFHNGTWKDWEDRVLRAAEIVRKDGIEIPDGKWSDSRAMAWLASIYSPGFLNILATTQKGVLFGPTDETTQYFTGSTAWKEVKGVFGLPSDRGIWCSNDHFDTRTSSTIHYHSGYKPFCKDSCCHETEKLDADGRCPQHPLKKLEAGSQGVAQAPFPQKSPGPLISVGLAERLQERGRLSKNKLKKVKALYDQLHHPKPSRRISALKELSELSEEIRSSLHGRLASTNQIAMVSPASPAAV
jgi:hypothetical protein